MGIGYFSLLAGTVFRRPSRKTPSFEVHVQGQRSEHILSHMVVIVCFPSNIIRKKQLRDAFSVHVHRVRAKLFHGL